MYKFTNILLFVTLLATACSNEEFPCIDEKTLFINPLDLSTSFSQKFLRENERFQKICYDNASYQLEYEYQSEDKDLYLYQIVSIHADPAAVASCFQAIQAGTRVGALTGGASVRKICTDLSWGEESVFIEFRQKGQLVGHFFIARKNNKLYSFLIKGLKADDKIMWAKLLQPRLTSIEKL